MEKILLICLVIAAILALAKMSETHTKKVLFHPKHIKIIAQGVKNGQPLICLHYVEEETGKAGVIQIEETKCAFHFQAEYNQNPYAEVDVDERDNIHGAAFYLPESEEIHYVV